MSKTDYDLGPLLLIDNTDESGYIISGRYPGTPPTTASKFAVGCKIMDTSNNFLYENVGTVAVPVWHQVDGLRVATVTLATADFIATTTGSLSHAQGLIVVPAAPAGYVNQFISGVVSLTASNTPLTGGGNVTFNIGGGGAALTGLLASPALCGATSVINQFVPLSTVGFPITKATSINLVTAVAITNTNSGVSAAKVSVVYRQLPI